MLHATCHLPLYSRWWARATPGPPRGQPDKQVGEGWLPVFLPLVGSRTTQGPNPPLQHAPGLQSFPPFRKYCKPSTYIPGQPGQKRGGLPNPPFLTGSGGLAWNTGWQADLPSTGCRKLTNRMLLQSFLSNLYFLKHCHCQSPSSRGRRQAANEQLAVNYPLPNHLHLISGTGKAGTQATSREKVGTEQRRETAPNKALQRQKVPQLGSSPH